jgi:L-seryl-tRNA(Ser) seleniumtransferase
VSWDPALVGLTAGEVGRLLLDGEPRIMTHASGQGHSFPIRPVAMRPDDYKVVADRLTQVFRGAPNGTKPHQIAAPAAEIEGHWNVSIRFACGSAEHKLFLTSRGNKVSGMHVGWAAESDLLGSIDGDKVLFRSELPTPGQSISYTFTGHVSGDTMSGELSLGEYGPAEWTAKRHTAA